jgi:hypothetical protein
MIPQPSATSFVPAVGTADNMLGARVPPHLGSSLELLLTSSQHGVIQPIRPTPLDEYQKHLAATQALWVVDET